MLENSLMLCLFSIQSTLLFDYTGYPKTQVLAAAELVAEKVAETEADSTGQELRAAFHKYDHQRFFCVSSKCDLPCVDDILNAWP